MSYEEGFVLIGAVVFVLLRMGTHEPATAPPPAPPPKLPLPPVQKEKPKEYYSQGSTYCSHGNVLDTCEECYYD